MAAIQGDKQMSISKNLYSIYIFVPRHQGSSGTLRGEVSGASLLFNLWQFVQMLNSLSINLVSDNIPRPDQQFSSPAENNLCKTSFI